MIDTIHNKSMHILIRLHDADEWQHCNLTHLPLVPQICVAESGKHLFRLWLVAYSAPSHYLHQWWIIVNWTLRKIFFMKMHLIISSDKWGPFCHGEMCYSVWWYIPFSTNVNEHMIFFKWVGATLCMCLANTSRLTHSPQKIERDAGHPA